MDEFLKAPSNINKNRAVLDKNNNTYSLVADIDGTQPYYTYQGIGNITGTREFNVVHNSIEVTHLTTQVIHTT